MSDIIPGCRERTNFKFKNMFIFMQLDLKIVKQTSIY